MKTLLITISICCLFCSCKKNKMSKPEIYNIRFSADALSYVQLPLNKYFIYKDSASGTFDSVVVTQSSIEEKYQPEINDPGQFISHVPAFNYQDFTLLLTEYNGASQEDWFYGVASNYGKGFIIASSDTASLSLLEKDRANNTNLNYVFFYPLTPYSSIQENIAVIPSINIEGKIYTNVELYSNRIDSTSADYLRSTNYWSKGLGIIKSEIKTSSSVKTETLVRNG